MSSADSIISRIIEMDAQADAVRAEGAQEANRIREEYHQRILRDRETLEKEKTKKTEQVLADAQVKRDREIAAVRLEFAESARAIDQTASAKVDAAVRNMASRVKGFVS